MKKPASSRPSKIKKANSKAAGTVRIIGGQLKRRTVAFIDTDGLRPTPDRLRETLFNWLLTDIHDAQILDSCAGSGVLGFEALSRGAAHCTFIEASRPQSQLLAQNAQQLQLNPDSYQIIYGNAEQVIYQKHFDAKPFDIVFIDPPYAMDLWHAILSALITTQLLRPQTLIYLEADKDLSTQLDALALSQQSILNAQGLNGFECLKHTKVGQVVAGLYRLSSS